MAVAVTVFCDHTQRNSEPSGLLIACLIRRAELSGAVLCTPGEVVESPEELSMF